MSTTTEFYTTNHLNADEQAAFAAVADRLDATHADEHECAAADDCDSLLAFAAACDAGYAAPLIAEAREALRTCPSVRNAAAGEVIA